MCNSDGRKLKLIYILLSGILLLSLCSVGGINVYAHDISSGSSETELDNSANTTIEVISPYFSIEHRISSDGTELSGYMINGPSTPPDEYKAERMASIMSTTDATILPNFPSYNWVFGCSAVSASMIAAYYDQGAYPNIYTGPTNGGVMPITNTSWGTWSDGYQTYPNNPLVASHNGVDERTTRGSIDDYWVKYDSTENDPYITYGWVQHSWGTAIGDYMKTSQSASPYNNKDGETAFYNFEFSSNKLTCNYMEDQGYAEKDGTYGRKLFYEARGYTVGDCYNQNTDNYIVGGFSLANFQAEINIGNPVLLNLAGHSVVGYGYNGSTIYIRDTWDSDPNQTYTMPWGGSYQGFALMSVSVVHLIPPHSSKFIFVPLIAKQIIPESIKNPDFEQGPINWTEYSTHEYELILNTSGLLVPPYHGSWAVWLGGEYDEISYIQQQVLISANYPYLSYWHWIASQDICGYDFGKVLINNIVVDEYDLCQVNNTVGWVKHVVNLSAYAGSSVTLQIRAECDSSINSNLFIDLLSFQSSTQTLNPLAEPLIDIQADIPKQDVISK
jgi:hypothetical protein